MTLPELREKKDQDACRSGEIKGDCRELGLGLVRGILPPGELKHRGPGGLEGGTPSWAQPKPVTTFSVNKRPRQASLRPNTGEAGEPFQGPYMHH